jgi:hypothetical protein
MLSINWDDAPTWALFGGAIVTALHARLAFKKQSEEVQIVGRQPKTSRS